jgi:hypothetical protein
MLYLAFLFIKCKLFRRSISNIPNIARTSSSLPVKIVGANLFAKVIYPSHLKMLVSGQQNNPYSRRIKHATLMITRTYNPHLLLMTNSVIISFVVNSMPDKIITAV